MAAYWLLLLTGLFSNGVLLQAKADVTGCATLFRGLSASFGKDLASWLKTQKQASIDLIDKNIQPNGAVAAAGGGHNSEYPYHWVRDAALVMRVETERLTTAAGDKREILEKLKRYASFSRGNQLTPSVVVDSNGYLLRNPDGSGLLKAINPGEPKFHLDGSSYDEMWGRPQNDGPALRALTLTQFARYVDSNSADPTVRSVLGDPKTFVESLYNSNPKTSTIKTDLEFIAHHWRDPSFDLWEEVKGDHFYTRLVQRQALMEGAELADHFHDPGAADYYRLQANEIEKTLKLHWDPEHGILRDTLNRSGGKNYKHSGLDSAVILGVLHAQGNNPLYKVNDERVLSTVHHLEGTFRTKYRINEKMKRAVAIGRYPEDRYCGYPNCDSEGNPWILLTNTFGDFYFQLANQIETEGQINLTPTNRRFYAALVKKNTLPENGRITPESPYYNLLVKAIRDKGDGFLAIVKSVTPKTGQQSEQFDQNTGAVLGAEDLTWNAASFLQALISRDRKMRPQFAPGQDTNH